MLPNVRILTSFLSLNFGLKNNNTYQELSDGVVIYPKDWFHPKNILTGKIECTENTHGIHHFAGTWVTKTGKFNLKFFKFISHCVPKKWFEKKTYSKERKEYEKYYKQFVKENLPQKIDK